MTRICICGGGGLGHTCGAVLSSAEGISVSLYTKHPESWHSSFVVDDPNGKAFNGHFDTISNNPQEVIPNADIILLCLPAYLIESTLIEIRPYLSHQAIVGAVVGNTGFFLFAHQLLPKEQGLFAFQRVPYISRVEKYGEKAHLLGYKDELLVAVENVNDINGFVQQLSQLLLTSVNPVDSFYEVTLSNSNPILHTGRLYTMWKDWNGQPYTTNPLFYWDWTNEASEIEIKMDQELFDLLKVLGVSTKHFKTLLDHYDSIDAASLTAKLRSIPSYATIHSPMIETQDGWIPDFKSRYFTEDFPFGLKTIHELARQHNIPCPTIDMVFQWGQKMILRNS